VLLAALAMVAAMLLAVEGPASAAGTTFTVTSTADTDDATPDGACTSCTLREAIQEANHNNDPAQVDTIRFNIPGTGVKTISPATELPAVTEPVVVNGYSQPGSSANTLARGTNARLLVQINGAKQLDFFNGLTVKASNSVVKGLVINRLPESNAILVRPQGGSAVTNVRIEGNFLGTDPSGTLARATGIGVDIVGSSDNTVGGTTRASRNLISGNNDGVVITGDAILGSGADGNEVRGNLIGTQKDGIKPLGNGFGGVLVFGNAQGNSVLSNSVFANGQIGIDLGSDGPTANDPGDADAGPNGLQNRPSLGSAKTVSGKTTIKGTLNSRPGNTYKVQFFSNPSGTNQGRRFIGQKTGLAVDGSGTASFTFSPATAVPAGQTVTATATNEFTGDTSEFSGARTVASS
jgi:CSLREA domain-containing protein